MRRAVPGTIVLTSFVFIACSDAPGSGAGRDAGPPPPDALVGVAPGTHDAGSMDPARCAGPEVCNGVDDDCNGEADEIGCACGGQMASACYAGPPGTRGVGACADGMRVCDLGESWGPCEGWKGPSPEACGDGADDDCDGRVDEDCDDCAAAEACGNDADEDCDGRGAMDGGARGPEGAADSSPPSRVDEDCQACAAAEVCGNGRDDDCNGAIDDGCGGCQPEEACGNGRDDDCDLIVDEDCDCRDLEVCGNGRDDDCNGTVDDGCAACAPREACGNGLDDDCNGLIDDGCQPCGLFEICGDGMDDDCDRQVDEDCNCQGFVERCGDHADNDCDGQIDEGDCTPDDGSPEPCNPNLHRACFGANPAQIGVGPCRAGQQTCAMDGRWGPCEGAVLPAAQEVCDNGVDDDCEGHVDQCAIQVPIDLSGDCITTRCPDDAPNPVGCNIQMAGDDPRGCVANQPNTPSVYFQEGDDCGAGHVRGVLMCSSVPGNGLNEQNCQINKRQRFYPASRRGCPDTD